MTVSDDGRWAVVGKHYDRNKDTVLIVNHDLNNKKRFSVIGMNQFQQFLNNKALLSFCSGKAQYLDLKTGNKISYFGIRNVYALSETGQYALLNDQEQLSVFDLSGQEMYRLESIKTFPVSNGKDQWYGYRKDDDGYEVIDFSAKQAKIVYETKNKIQRISISDSQNYLLIIESDPLRSAENLFIIDRKTGKIVKPIDGVAEKGEYIALNETSQSGRWIITAERKVPADKNLEIWYGNDGNLNRHEKGFSAVRRYWLYDFPSNRLTVIPSNRFSSIMSTGNKNIFLVFNDGERHNYTSLLQNLNMHLYNTESREFVKLDTIKNASLYLPKEGSTLLYRSLDNLWKVFDTEYNSRHTIQETFLENPLFTPDGKKIYFESDRGLFVYELGKNRLRDLKIGSGKQVRILNKNRNNQGGSVSQYQHGNDNGHGTGFG